MNRTAKILSAIILAASVFLFVSCKEDPIKYKFVRAVMEEPERIDEIINMAPQITSLYKSLRFETPEEQYDHHALLISGIKDFFKDGYTVVCDTIYIQYEKEFRSRSYFHDITMKGLEDEPRINFKWVYDINRWKLFNIYFTTLTKCREPISKPLPIDF